MSRINCHSAFKHYEMFHSRGGDVINIGSNNTTIFNCGGSHFGGGFWGGFGLGLGNAFGSLFSGFGGFGMGGFGFPSFGGGFGNFGGGWSSPWGGAGSSTRVSRSTDNTCHCNENAKAGNASNEKLDPDRETIGKLWDRKNELFKKGAQPSSADLQKLLDDINEAEKNQDKNPIHDATDNADFNRLKYGLEDAIKAAQQREAQPKVTAKAPAAADGAGAVEAGDDDGVSDNAHTYLDGYTNYDGKTELQDDDVIKAHDTSGKTKDTVIVNGKTSKITKSTNGSHPQTIVIQDTKDITYTYKETVNGEYVYVSDQDHQEYILQKHGDKYELIQYDWHEGYGKKDWSSKE